MSNGLHDLVAARAREHGFSGAVHVTRNDRTLLAAAFGEAF